MVPAAVTAIRALLVQSIVSVLILIVDNVAYTYASLELKILSIMFLSFLLYLALAGACNSIMAGKEKFGNREIRRSYLVPPDWDRRGNGIGAGDGPGGQCDGGGEVRKAENIVTAFVLGCAVGMYSYRLAIINSLRKIPMTRCDYCQFRMLMGKEPFPQKKQKRNDSM